MDQSFLGTGMKFPPEVDPATGRFRTVSGADSVRESIYLILMTQRAERFARPGFGSNLLSYTFMDMNRTAFSILSGELRDVLLTQEPRIGEVTIGTEPHESEGYLLITVDYVIRQTNVRDNLVFPFYLNGSAFEEEEEPEFYEPEIVEEVSN